MRSLTIDGMTDLDSLRCLSCGRILVGVVEHQGWTAVVLYEADALTAVMTRGEIRCPKCSAVRRFYSVPLSAVRLGIAGGA